MEEKCTQAFRNLLIALCVLCSLSLPLYAESENRLGIRFYGSFLYTDTVPNALFFFSDIKKNDSFELRKALRNHNIDTLVLSSRGGSVWEGLSMAGIIHDKGLTTYVPKLGLEGRGDCASACSFMFFAGKTREAEGGVGVHQFYSGSASESAEVEETEEIAQFTVSEIIGFLNEFETPPFVFERMFQQSKMYYFDNNEMKKIARTVTPLKQEQRSEIEGFINEFLIELASFEEEEETQAEQKSEPEKSPPPKQQPAKEEADTDTQKQIVQNIQTELNRLNCNAGVADGVIGNGTKSALARYATAAGKFIDEARLKDGSLLSELQTSQVTCNAIIHKNLIGNLVCSSPQIQQVQGFFQNEYSIPFEKVTIFNLSKFYNPNDYNKKIETCKKNGSCDVGNVKELRNTADEFGVWEYVHGQYRNPLWEDLFGESVKFRWFTNELGSFYDNYNYILEKNQLLLQRTSWIKDRNVTVIFEECSVLSNEQVYLDEPDTYTQKQIVKNIQTELNRLNCNAGVADGVIGNGTKSALARYAIAAGKFIDEVMLQDQELLLELRESQITCKLPSKSYAQNLVCSGREDPGYPSLAKLEIYDFLKEPLFSRIYSIEYCLSNGACQEGSFKRSKNTNLNGDSVHLFWEINKVDPIGVRWFFKKQKEQLEFSEVARVGADKVRMEYTLNKCILNSNTTNTATQKTYTTNPKSLTSSYKYETCARVSNKKECSTGNLKLRRLKDGKYEFEEETNSPEVFYGEIKLKGSEVELQMVDFIEGVAVPINGTGTLNKNNKEIVFMFSDEHVIKTFGKAGINLKNGEITDLTIRWF